MAAMAFELSKDQREVLANVWGWLQSAREPYLTIGGYAGTGKTTLLAYIRSVVAKKQPKAKVAFCAYTGKASQVLYRTLTGLGIGFEHDSVSTLHSLLYAPITGEGGVIAGWKRKPKLPYDLVLVDEASMVDGSIWQDLLDYGVPVIAVGDHGQLPPIGGDFNLMEQPQLKLEEIHRQQRDNPIIKMSVLARELGSIPIKDYGNGVRKLHRYDSASGQEIEELLQSFSDDLLILVGYNTTRIKLNQEIRRRLEFEYEQPLPGDRVICLKNNWEKGIYNGMVGKVRTLRPESNEQGVQHWYDADIEMEDGLVNYSGRINSHQFNQATTLTRYEDLHYATMGDLFDFGYALTVHKAQGSQARRVLLLEEKNKHMNDEDWRRWLYTAVTRAQEQLTIVGE